MGFEYIRPHSETLAHTWLIQRLNKPSKGFGPLGVDNPFSFGGGLLNGGLSKDAMNLLRDIFSFDYMGAAEFEFGSVPAALSRIAEHATPSKVKKKSNLVAHSFEFDKANIEKNWKKDSVQATGVATIYVLCHKDHVSQVEELITKLASERFNSELKESTRLASALDPQNDWDTKVGGWLELNNGFMFFVDEEMFNKTADLFGIKRQEK